MAALYALIFDGLVVQVSPAQFPVHSALAWAEIDAVTPQPAAGWTAFQSNGLWSFSAPAAASATPEQQAAALIAGGLAVTSAGTPAMSAVYPCDAATQAKIAAIQLRLASDLGFAGGATQPWKDSAGNWHELTAAQFTALAGAIFAFVQACELFRDGFPGATLPSATATIA